MTAPRANVSKEHDSFLVGCIGAMACLPLIHACGWRVSEYIQALCTPPQRDFPLRVEY